MASRQVLRAGLVTLSIVYGLQVASAIAASSETSADENAPDSATPSVASDLGEIVVTARRRAENLQNVPVAVTVVSQDTFDRAGVFDVNNLQTTAPGLNVTGTVGSNSRADVSFSIRGQSIVYGALFPAVVTYFSEVPVTQFGTGQFFDLDNIQVLRGPQGVQFGRVTDGGNIMIGPKRPTEDVDASLTVKAGDYNLVGGSGYFNVPIVSDMLLVRAAFDIASRSGFTQNVYNGQWLDSLKYQSGRVGVTFKPTTQIQNYTVVQYEHTDDSGTSTLPTAVNPAHLSGVLGSLYPLVTNGSAPAYGINNIGNVVPFQPGLTPLSVPAFVAAMENSVSRQAALGPRQVFQTSPSFQIRDNLYVVNTTDINLMDNLQLKNIFGYTNTKDNQATMYEGGTGPLLATCHSGCPFGDGIPLAHQEQLSEEMRLAGQNFNDRLNWSAGFYADEQKPGGPYENADQELGALEVVNIQDVITKSRAGSAFSEYDFSDWVPGLKLNAGYRYTHDSIESSNLVASALMPSPGLQSALAAVLGPELAAETANAVLPAGVCGDYSAGIFSASCKTISATFHANTYTVGPSFQFNQNAMVYAKLSRGYRPGGVNATAPTNSGATYQPEFDLSTELGLKSQFQLGPMQARANLAVYHDKYSEIQELVDVTNPDTGASNSVISNTNAAVVQGVEFEGTLVPLSGLTVQLNYAYTDAHFNRNGGPLPDGCNPDLSAIANYCTYNRFVATPVNQGSLSAAYQFDLPQTLGSITFGGQLYFQSSEAQITNSYISPGSISPGYSLLNVDAAWKQVGGQPLDLTFFMTNVTDKLYTINRAALIQASGLGMDSVNYGAPRMFGFTATYRFGASAGHTGT
jgi:iron complex outermembrane receptor protein